MTTVQIASVRVVQLSISSDIAKNRDSILAEISDASSGTILVFPEGALSGYSEDPSFLRLIDPKQIDAALITLKRRASRAGVHLMFGSCLYEAGQRFNAALYFGPGDAEFIYRKVNLAMSERGVISAGDRLQCFELRFNDRVVKAAFQLCREIRFPEQWQTLARQGAEIFIYCTHALGDKLQAPVWRSHLVSRAAENQRFVLSANAAGVAQKCPSAIIDPRGYVRWECLSAETATGTAEIDLSEVSNWYLGQSRTDIANGDQKANP